jgi:hypothetical protein
MDSLACYTSIHHIRNFRMPMNRATLQWLLSGSRKTKENSMAKKLLILSAASILLVGCATRPPAPDEQIGAARSAVSSAEDAGARDYAADPLHRARELLERAEAARSRGDYDVARRLAGEAEIEARFAAFRTRSARADEGIVELEDSIRALRAEIQAASGGVQ